MRTRITIAAAVAAGAMACGSDGATVTGAGPGSRDSAATEGDEPAGGLGVSVRFDWTYDCAGVLVVREAKVGPEWRPMAVAVARFRSAAGEALGLGPLEEQAAWDSVTEIRWTAEDVPGGGALEAGVVRVQWTGCAGGGALYPLLEQHYLEATGAVAGGSWATELAAEALELCAL